MRRQPPDRSPQREDYWGNVNPVGPRSVYDEAKRYAEALTMAYRRANGVDTRIVRIFNTYGPRMRPDDGRAIPVFISQALRGEAITVNGNGSQTRSFCYVTDLVARLHALLLSDLGEPVNIGNPSELTVLELAKKIVAMTGSDSPIVFREFPVDDPRLRLPDIAKAREKLNWTPLVDLDEGLAHTIAWFQETGVGASPRR